MRRFLLTIFTLLLMGVAHAEEGQNFERPENWQQLRSERGIIDMTEMFVPKGSWIFGTTASFFTSSYDNYTIALLNGLTTENYSFAISPMVSYAITNNITAGMRVNYSRSSFMVDHVALTIPMGDEDMSLSLNDYKALSHSYSAVAISRQYIPFGSDKRFALFNEFQFSVGGFASRFMMDTPVKGTFASGWNMGVGLAPGIVAFATNNVAFEVNVGVLGISYTHCNQVHNQVDVGHFDSNRMSFAINILSVALGFYIYL